MNTQHTNTEAANHEASRIARDIIQMELEGLAQMANLLARQAGEMPQGSTVRAHHTSMLAKIEAAMGCLAGNRDFWPKVSGQALKIAHSEIRAASGD